MTASFFCRFHYHLMCSIRRTKFDIVFNSILKKINILKHYRKVTQQTIAGIFFHIISSYTDVSFLNIPKTCDKADKGRLAGTGRPYECTSCPFWDLNAYISNHIFPSIRKRNMFKLNVKMLWHNIRSLFIQNRHVQNIIQPVQRSFDHTGNRSHTAKHLHTGINHKT